MISLFNCWLCFIKFDICSTKESRLGLFFFLSLKLTNLVAFGMIVCSLLFNDDDKTRFDDIVGHGHVNVV